MFGFSVHFEESATQIVVTEPFSFIAIGVAVLITLVSFISLKSKHFPPTRSMVHGVILVLVWMFALSAERVVLDRDAGTASIEDFQFFHWSRQTLPLSTVDSVRVRTGSTSSAIQLQFTDGHVHSMSGLNQESGKKRSCLCDEQVPGKDPGEGCELTRRAGAG